MKTCKIFSQLLALTLFSIAGCGGDDKNEDDIKDGGLNDAGNNGGEKETGYFACMAAFDGEFTKLSGDIKIERDNITGMPHITAENPVDAAFAVGWMHAHDRFAQMEYVRLRALGRRAEFLGERFLKDDISARTFGFKRWAQMTLEKIKSEHKPTYNLLLAYVSGINRYLKDAEEGKNGARLPYGFGEDMWNFTPEPWEPIDVLTVGKLLGFGLSSDLDYEILGTMSKRAMRRGLFSSFILYEPIDKTFYDDRRDESDKAGPPKTVSMAMVEENPPELIGVSKEDAEAFFDYMERMNESKQQGSNNWAVSGNHTESGLPILCNDTHMGHESPSRFYIMHIETRDGCQKTIGYSFPGVPFFMIGATPTAAWGATVNFADVIDLYEEQYNDDKTAFVYDSGEVPPEIVIERIKVRKDMQKPAAEEDTVERKVVFSKHGPILDEGTGLPVILLTSNPSMNPISVSWTGMAATTEPVSFHRFNYMKDCNDFLHGVSFYGAGMQNFVCADASGNIALHSHGDVPKRKTHDYMNPPTSVMPGGGDYDWEGFLDDKKMPQLFNPETGFVVSANNDPLGGTADNDVLNDDVYWGSFFDPGTRAFTATRKISELIDSGNKITSEQMRALQTDTYTGTRDRFVPFLLEAIEKSKTDPTLERYAADPRIGEVYGILKDWDGYCPLESHEASIYWMWISAFVNATFRPSMGEGVLQIIFSQAAKSAGKFLMKHPLFLLERGELPGGGISFHDPEREGLTGAEIYMLHALEKALDALEAFYGSKEFTDWKWGELHKARFRSIVGGRTEIPETPMPGGIDTLFVGEFSIAPASSGELTPKNLNASQGASMRFTVAFQPEGLPEIYHIMPGGVSGDPDSPYFADQLEDYSLGKYRKWIFNKEELKDKVEETFNLTP